MSDYFNIHKGIIALWIRQAVYFEGNFKVSNSGRDYISVSKGKIMLYKQGHLKRYVKEPEKLEIILHTLVSRYLNFEHNEYYYYYSRGEWRRCEKKD